MMKLFRPIVNSQKVASNQRELDATKPLAVSWDRTAATVGQLVAINGAVKVHINSLIPPSVWVLFNGNRYAQAEKVKVQNGQITAEWRVVPFRSGDFNAGGYDVEITYGSLSGRTTTALKIVTPGGDRNVSSFG